jgi:transcriptional regulator with XRE-family HTH domain
MICSPIKARRINLEIESQEAIKLLGISQITFYKLEQRIASPSSQLIKKLAEVYKCTTDEILKDLKNIG